MMSRGQTTVVKMKMVKIQNSMQSMEVEDRVATNNKFQGNGPRINSPRLFGVH